MKLRNLFAYVPLVLLCVLLSTRWMFVDAWPDSESNLWSQAAAAAILAVLSLGMAYGQPAERRRVERWSGSAFVAGVLLFTGINASQLAGPVSPRNTDLFIALALTPVVISMLLNTENAGDGVSVSDLAPGLLGSAGLLLILPQPALGAVKPDIVLGCAPLCAGAGAVWLARPGHHHVSAKRATVAFAGAALLFTYFARKGPQMHPRLLGTAMDMLSMLLVVGSVAALGVRRFAAQFAAVPLLFLLEGLILERVRPSWVQVSGLAMLTVAAMLLLRHRGAVERPGPPHLLP